MTLSAAASSSTFSLAIPVWALWGIGLSIVVMILMFGGAWLLAKSWETITFGFMGTVEDIRWPKPRAFVIAYVTYGLLPSLTLTWIWSQGQPIAGVVAGITIFLAVWMLHVVFDKKSHVY